MVALPLVALPETQRHLLRQFDITVGIAPFVVVPGVDLDLCAIVLIVTSAVASTRRNPAFVDADAEVVERRVRALVDAGADEAAVRDLVRLTLKLGRDS